jgi:glucose-1-phosphate cytidylyltransferase
LSYGDGVCNVNIKKLIKFHILNKKIATLTAVKQENRFGVLEIKNKIVKKIKEKPVEYINGGFFVLSKKVFKYLENDKTIFERDCLPKLSSNNELSAFIHNGFWGCMDTMRDKRVLNSEWKKKNCRWKTW